jgi:hypothetical protein
MITLRKSFDAVPNLSGTESLWSGIRDSSLPCYSPERTISPSTRPPEASVDTRIDRDNQAAAAILSTTPESILSAHIDLLSCSKVTARRSRMVFNSLEKLYGTSGPQYSFALGRKFIGKRCGDEEDVEAWVNQVQAQYRELKHLSAQASLVRSRCSLHMFSSMVWLTASPRSWTRSGRLGENPSNR